MQVEVRATCGLLDRLTWTEPMQEVLVQVIRLH